MTESPLLSHVAAEVRAEMARQRVTQRSLAAALGISQPSVSDRLTGTTAFNIPELETIARFLGVPVTQFLGADRGSRPGGGAGSGPGGGSGTGPSPSTPPAPPAPPKTSERAA